MRFKRAIVVALIGVTLGVTSEVFVPTLPLQAASPPVMSVVLRPTNAQGGLVSNGYFRITARPGTTNLLYAYVGNAARKRLRMSLVPVDATSGISGGIAFALPEQPRRSVGAWIALPTSHVTLPAGRATVVGFAVRVPKHVAPGQYVGGLSAFGPASRPSGRRGRFGLALQTRVVDAVVVTIPGHAIARFSIVSTFTQNTGRGVRLFAKIRNSGGLLVKGWGHLWVWAPGWRRPSASMPMTLGTTVPKSTFLYPAVLFRRPIRGRYTYALKVWWRGGQTTKRGSFRLR